MSTANSNKSSTKPAAKPVEAAKPTGLEALIEKVADKVKFLGDRDVLALANYLKARFGVTAWQPAVNKDVIFYVEFKNEEKEVVRTVAIVAVFANGDYYTRFKVIVTANGTKRSFFPVSLDDAINIIQDTANPYHYSNRISAVSKVKDEAKTDEAAA